MSQWGEVKKKATDRKQAKEAPASTDPIAASARAGRGRGGIESRGRARGDRGRAGRGGRAGAATNGTRAVSGGEPSATISTPAPTPGSTAPQAKEPTADPAIEADWESVEHPKSSSVIPEGTKKGWASLFAKQPPPPVQNKPQTAAVAAAPAAPTVAEKEAVPEPAVEPSLPVTETAAPAASQKTPLQKPPQPVIPAVPATSVNPQKRDLTSTNLEQIPDVSAPAPTATAASTIGSGIDPGAAAAASGYSRIPSSAYPASATKPARTPGLQRRVMEQQQAVVMPGNHAVDRAAVQFGSMGLNGDAVDIDDNREQAETRAQPPQHSPVAPRASLPPAAQTPQSLETGAAGRPAPGLPPVSQASATDSFANFGYSEPQQKPFDPFTQHVSQPQQQIAEPFANQAPVQPATTGGEYSPFHAAAAADNRFPYYSSYGSYGQTQDAPTGPRAGVGFGVSGAETQSQIPTTQPPSRYGNIDANSGQSTPNSTVPGIAPAGHAAHTAQHGYGYGFNYSNNPDYASYMNQMNQMNQQQQQQYNGGRTRPMFDDARRYEGHYMHPQYQQVNQQQYGYNQYPYGKAGMYAPPTAYSYDQTSSSPANTGSFGRESVYGRTGPAQQPDNITAGANSFGADVFRSNQPPAAADEPKGFDSKASGPSPSLAQNRPGSATNSVPGQPQPQAQIGLPLQGPQGQQGQQAFGAYPQYSGLGGLNHQGAANQNQASAYGTYGNGFSNYYGRGGWAGNYGH